jgi:hypothetical protein
MRERKYERRGRRRRERREEREERRVGGGGGGETGESGERNGVIWRGVHYQSGPTRNPAAASASAMSTKSKRLPRYPWHRMAAPRNPGWLTS